MSPEQTSALLALHGGTPVRRDVLPYGRQVIEDDDVQAVVEVLRSEWLTTGPRVGAFEEAFAAFTGAREAVAVSNGTAALHAAMHAVGVEPGDEVIVPAMTFAASSNAVVYMGATPVFADVDPQTLLLDPDSAAAKITSRTKAIVAVDYAGQPCDYPRLRALADRHGLALVADACHAIGGALDGRAVGTLADVSTFSFHPVKHVTTGEGGMITTDAPELARRMRTFRNHGITTDHRQRAEQGSWFYEMVDLGYNYRLADFQCALGMNQLRKLPGWIQRRRAIARRYDEAIAALPAVRPLAVRAGAEHAYHLYVVRLDLARLDADRATVFQALRAEGIGVNVHYIPVYLHPFYRERFGMEPGLCPEAEAAYAEIVSLPMFAAMRDADVDDVVTALGKVAAAYTPVVTASS
jgi:perosamine synthetase